MPRLCGAGSLHLEARVNPDTDVFTHRPPPPVAAVPALPVEPPTHSQRSGGCPAPLLLQAQPTGLSLAPGHRLGARRGSHKALRLQHRLELLPAPSLRGQQWKTRRTPEQLGAEEQGHRGGEGGRVDRHRTEPRTDAPTAPDKTVQASAVPGVLRTQSLGRTFISPHTSLS